LATRGIILDGVYDYLRINELTQDNTVASTVSGAGRLEKTGSFTTTLTGHNTFTGGTNLMSGGLTLSTTAALNTYTTPGGTKGLVDVTGNGTVTFDNAGPFTNRFQVTGGTLSFATTQNTTLSGVNSGIETGGAVFVDGQTLQMNNDHTMTFVNNGNGAGANDIYLAGSSAALQFIGSGNTFIDSGIAGIGTVTKTTTSTGVTQIGENSDFDGTTSILGGVFRVVQGKYYGLASTTGTFGNAVGSTVAGGGTIKADTITVSGTVSPDSDTLSATKSAVDSSHIYGTVC